MVCVTDRSGEIVSGFAVDVDQDGSLIVDCGGEIKRVVSGVLEFR
jgi:biotin-(acetyl-CoA carboxylase) ligase